MSLPEYDVEVMTFGSKEELLNWKKRDDVEYVEPDHKVYPLAEVTAYRINTVMAVSAMLIFRIKRFASLIQGMISLTTKTSNHQGT